MDEKETLEEKIRKISKNIALSYVGGFAGIATSIGISGVGSYLENQSLTDFGVGLSILSAVGSSGVCIYNYTKYKNLRKKQDKL